MMKRLMLVLAACGESESTGQSRVSLEDSGTVCLRSSPTGDPQAAQSFQAASPLFLSFEVPDICLSSSCSEIEGVSCHVTDGSPFRITSVATWTDTRPLVEAQGASCFDDCVRLIATCDTSPLPAGVHDFVFGAQALALEIPSESDTAPCLTN